MQEFNSSYYMQSMGIPCQYFPMATMPEEQLESMYPKSYYTIHPAVERTCDRITASCGPMFTPTHEQLESMVDQVYDEVEADVCDIDNRNESSDDRQFLPGGRRFLRDLIAILLIRDLINRRRPYYGYQPYYGVTPYYGVPGVYGGYPLY